MRILKRILAGVALVLAALVVVAYFLPREAQVTRSIDIAAPPSAIFPIASDLRRFNEWSPWVALDPATTYTLSGPTDGVGQTLNWASKDPTVGSGMMALTIVDPDKYVQPGYAKGVMPKTYKSLPAAQLKDLVDFLSKPQG